MSAFDLSKFETAGAVFDHHIERADELAKEAKERIDRMHPKPQDSGRVMGSRLSWGYGWNNPGRSDGLWTYDDRLSIPTSPGERKKLDPKDVHVIGSSLFTIRQVHESEEAYRDGGKPAGHQLFAYSYSFLPKEPSSIFEGSGPDQLLEFWGVELDLMNDPKDSEIVRIKPNPARYPEGGRVDCDQPENSGRLIANLIIPRQFRVAAMSPEQSRQINDLALSMTQTLDVTELLLAGCTVDEVREEYPGVISPPYILRKPYGDI